MVAKEKKVKRNGIPQKMALIMNALLVVVKTRTYFSECTMATLCLEMMHGYQPKRRNVRKGVGRCYSNISVALIYKHAADHGCHKISTSNTQISHSLGRE